MTQAPFNVCLVCGDCEKTFWTGLKEEEKVVEGAD